MTPDGEPAAGAAAVWGLAQRCALGYADSIRRAGIASDGGNLGDALFDAILASPHGLTFTVDDYDETMRRLETSDKKISLAVPVLLDELDMLATSDCADREQRLPVRARCGRAPIVDCQHHPA